MGVRGTSIGLIAMGVVVLWARREIARSTLYWQLLSERWYLTILWTTVFCGLWLIAFGVLGIIFPSGHW